MLLLLKLSFQPTNESNVQLGTDFLFLLDSGGQVNLLFNPFIFNCYLSVSLLNPSSWLGSFCSEILLYDKDR